jgi:hypothetical protein
MDNMISTSTLATGRRIYRAFSIRRPLRGQDGVPDCEGDPVCRKANCKRGAGAKSRASQQEEHGGEELA